MQFLVLVLVTLYSKDISSCIFLSNSYLMPEALCGLNHILEP